LTPLRAYGLAQVFHADPSTEQLKTAPAVASVKENEAVETFTQVAGPAVMLGVAVFFGGAADARAGSPTDSAATTAPTTATCRRRDPGARQRPADMMLTTHP
jgi:hypothetical protein